MERNNVLEDSNLLVILKEVSYGKKGETSGNVQKVKSIPIDCDYNALLFLVEQKETSATLEKKHVSITGSLKLIKDA